MEIKFEFVEFYPWQEENQKKKSKIIGTAHVYMHYGALGMDLRGILVIRNKYKIMLTIPTGRGFDLEEKIKTKYPIFNFCGEVEAKALMSFLNTICVEKIKSILNANRVMPKDMVRMRRIKPKVVYSTPSTGVVKKTENKASK